MSRLEGGVKSNQRLSFSGTTPAGNQLVDVLEEGDTVYLTLTSMTVEARDEMGHEVTPAPLEEDKVSKTVELDEDLALDCVMNDEDRESVDLQPVAETAKKVKQAFKDDSFTVRPAVYDHLWTDSFEADVKKVVKTTGETVPISTDSPPGTNATDGQADSPGASQTAGSGGTDAGTCPSCGRSLSGDKTFCPDCGEDLSTAPACPACDTDLDGDEAFCPECGHDLSSVVSTCPECSADLDGDESFCPECGHDLSSVVSACPECGADLEGDEAFCPECGHDLSG